MQLTDKAVTLYVGGGITASSNPISEFEETVRKAQTVHAGKWKLVVENGIGKAAVVEHKVFIQGKKIAAFRK